MTSSLKGMERLVRARIQLYNKAPFFAYLVLNLSLRNMKDFPKDFQNECKTMAVDPWGNLYFDEKFVDSLSESEVESCICHEVMHVALQHLLRLGKRQKEIWNLAADLTVNNMLINNNFCSIKGALNPVDNKFHKMGIKIKNIDKKNAEIIYDELYKQLDKQGRIINVLINGQFDSHIYGKGFGKSGKGGKGVKIVGGKMTAKERRELEEQWRKRLVEAATNARNRGMLPAGMERFIDDVLQNKLNWRTILYKYITKELPFDYSYSRPSKRSIVTGYYMPHVKKESVDVTVVIDTSGSIGQHELKEFMGEICGIARAFHNLKVRVICCDYDVQTDELIVNGKENDLMNIKIQGGGGTSFTRPLNYIKRKYPDTRLVLFLTDGYGDKVKGSNYPFRLVWCLCEGGDDSLIKDSGEVLKIE